LLALAPAFFNSCFAQSVATPKWSLTTITRVKPDMRQEFESCVRQLIAAYRKGGVPWFATFETFAGDTTEYTTVVPIMNFGDLDGPSVPARLLGETGWQRLSRKLAHCYTAQSCQYATPQSELEINRGDFTGGTYWVETRMVIAPGRMGDYLTWLRNDYRP